MFLRWLQVLASSEPSSLGAGEGRRVAALLAMAESVVHVAATTPDMLKIEGGGVCVCVCVCVREREREREREMCMDL